MDGQRFGKSYMYKRSVICIVLLIHVVLVVSCMIWDHLPDTRIKLLNYNLLDNKLDQIPSMEPIEIPDEPVDKHNSGHEKNTTLTNSENHDESVLVNTEFLLKEIGAILEIKKDAIAPTDKVTEKEYLLKNKVAEHGTQGQTVKSTDNASDKHILFGDKDTDRGIQEQLVSSVDITTETKDLMSDINSFVNPVKSLKRKLSIVLYRPFHGELISDKNNLNMRACRYNNCDVRISKSTTDPINAHAIIFQGNHIPKAKPRRKSPSQVYVFLDVEAPQYLHSYVNLDNYSWHDFFNWTMTYRLDSDIPYLYGGVLPKVNNGDIATDADNWRLYIQNARTNVYETLKTEEENDTLRGIPNKNYSAILLRKTKTAAWLVSHCNTKSNREAYVNNMREYIDIDVYGQCSGLVCAKGDASCDNMIINDYHFYLAFENSLCNDYIAEKVYNWYKEDIIIVVRGARKYSKLLPAGTFIDASEFATPRHLAEFLKALSLDEKRYTNYLKRKDKYRTIEIRTMTQMAYCELCKRLNNLSQYTNTVHDIHGWWTRDKCSMPVDIYQ